ncbi:MAG: murein transglycosylase [bacterium]|nr:MAG: murein transglycosylase [bacterium]
MARIFCIIALSTAFFVVDAYAEKSRPANIDQGLNLLKGKKYLGAFDSFSEIDTNSDERLEAQVDYLMGFALFRAGSFRLAEERLSYVADNPILGDYALFHIAKIQADGGRYEEAVKTAERFLENFPYSPLVSEIVLLNAKALEAIGMEDDAVRLLEKHIGSYPANAHEALWLLAENLEKTGDVEKAYRTYQKIFYGYPHTELAEPARMETVRMKKSSEDLFRIAPLSEKMMRAKLLMKNRMYEDAESYIRGMEMSGLTDDQRAKLIFMRAKSLDRMNRDDEAITVYQSITQEMPQTASSVDAMYYMAKIHWNRGNNRKTVRILDKLIADYPTDEKAAYAYNILGRIAESMGNYKLAVDKWRTAVKNYPAKDIAEVCLWRIGFRHYLLGNHKQAGRVFAEFLKKYPQSDQLSKILYWKGRNLIKQGKSIKAFVIYERIMNKFPLSYYSMLASGGMDRQIYTHMLRFKSYEEKLEKIINRRINSFVFEYEKQPELNETQMRLFEASRNWIELGFRERAKPLLNSLAVIIKPTQGELIWICNLYYLAGYYGDIPWRLQALVENPEISSGQKNLLTMMMYPVPHWRTIVSESKKNNLDPMLALAVIRQESRFDPDSISTSNARGLMQIIPPTAKRILKVLSMEDYSDNLLHEPETNIKMGVFYLAALIRKSQGEIAPALASYNAGMKTVRKWLKRNSYDEVEIFIETIPYPETRRYVKRVLRNYGIYKTIYDYAVRTEVRDRPSE